MAEPADTLAQLVIMRDALTAIQAGEAAVRVALGHDATLLSQPDTRQRFGTPGEGYNAYLRELDQLLAVLERMTARW